ncbi:hypothetical protein MHU86_21300 [Fragilaria crotonensis]|nr:hypothetical protein MHU86_21300 [Fragilaria crotonensis]
MNFTSIAIMFLLSKIVTVRSLAPLPQVYRPSILRRTAPRLFASMDTAPSDLKLINLLTIEREELQQHIVSWGFPKYRSEQVWKWIRDGVTSIDDMTNLPQPLKEHLQKYTKGGSLILDTELISKDGTRKRAYRLWDGQLIESVLMPYRDGRYTACISSQAGCAMGCVFCATGQMGFARQLTPDEILEQVARFDAELRRDQGEAARVSNVVFMGMGEPLANYRNVRTAINRITQDLGIGARKITVSTVGVIPNIRKLFSDPEMPQIRLAVSLHCASDQERTKLLPANARYGGLDELMLTLKEYIDTTNRRITLEWALIEDQNDDPATAKQLGNLVKRFGIRRDMVHVNVIPLNPTDDFGIACTPRVRRGIDINAGCGQLKAKLEKKSKAEATDDVVEVEDSLERDQLELADFIQSPSPQLGVYEDDSYYIDEDDDDFDIDIEDGYFPDQVEATEKVQFASPPSTKVQGKTEFIIEADAIDFEEDDYEDPEFATDWELEEAQRLIMLVRNLAPNPPPLTTTHLVMPPVAEDAAAGAATSTTSITDEDALREAKKRRKKLLKNLKAIDRLLERKQQDSDFEFNEEQASKVAREMEWRAELESVEHNLQ